ncbi:tetrahydrofolylpolyglutamate synthase [Rhypophila decipiens]
MRHGQVQVKLLSNTLTTLSRIHHRPQHLHLTLTLISTRKMASKSGRTYADAIDALNTLQTPFAVIEARRKAGIHPNADAIEKMRIYLSRIGYSSQDLDRLNVVHVAGTKGKGSTCAFVDSILAQYQKSRNVPRRIGLFTSPHLIAVRERIRIDSRPISEELFARYFFEVWDRLETAKVDGESEAELAPQGTKPIYARYLTLMSYHVFLSEGVDVAVYETGIGGEFDATNIVERPVASGISTLGIDHVYVLGDTVDKIAWHKAGIMKPGSPAFTIEQVPSATQVLKDRAAEKNVDLKILDIDPRLKGVNIRPDANFQKKNASLAIALAETALSKVDPSFKPGHEAPLPKDFVDGLEQVVWRGRCEVKEEGKMLWHVDGAHTVDSLKMAARWFVGQLRRPGPKVLIFNQQGRSEAIDFLDGLCNTVKNADPNGVGFQHVIFCTNVTYAETGYKRDFVNNQHDPKEIANMTMQRAFAERWSALDPTANVSVVPSIEEAINKARSLAETKVKGDDDEKVHALITGSLHLVGGALQILEGADAL